MLKILTFLQNSPIAWGILSVIAVVGLPLSIYFGVKGKIKRRISFSQEKLTLVRNGKNAFDKIKLFYGEEEIKNVAVTKFAFWNSGNVVLTRNDVVENKELTITCGENAKILEVQIIATNEETNKFEVTLIDEKHAIVTFDYIDVKEGTVVQVIHTGKDDFEITCKIKGGKPLKSIEPQEFTLIGRILKRILPKKFEIILAGSQLVLIALLFIGMFLSLFFEPVRKFMFDIGFFTNETSSIESSTSIMIILVLIAIMLYTFSRMFIKEFKIGVPNNLRKDSKFEL